MFFFPIRNNNAALDDVDPKLEYKTWWITDHLSAKQVLKLFTNTNVNFRNYSIPYSGSESRFGGIYLVSIIVDNAKEKKCR